MSQEPRSLSPGRPINRPVAYLMPGKVVDQRIRTSATGQANVDNAQPVTTDLVTRVAGKAFHLEIAMRKPTGDGASHHGQVGLIRGRRLHPSPQQHGGGAWAARAQPKYEVFPVTALHNVVTQNNKYGQKETFLQANLRSLDGVLRFGVNFSRAGEDCVAHPPPGHMIRNGPSAEDLYAWPFVDVDFAGSIADLGSKLVDSERSFELVRDDFVFNIHQRVGIAVYRNWDVSAESTGADNLTPAQILTIFGQKDCINVYTGEITRVSDDQLCFEHSINTFGGCSGAIVFLLDIQPEGVGVRVDDWGKAIAVHAGGDRVNGVLVNFAFKIQRP